MRMLLKNAAVFNGEENKIHSGKNILIENANILQITDCNEPTQADYEIDVKGKTVMPGLIDAHIHIMLYHQ